MLCSKPCLASCGNPHKQVSSQWVQQPALCHLPHRRQQCRRDWDGPAMKVQFSKKSCKKLTWHLLVIRSIIRRWMKKYMVQLEDVFHCSSTAKVETFDRTSCWETWLKASLNRKTASAQVATSVFHMAWSMGQTNT